MNTPAPLRSARFRSVWVAGLVSDTGDWLLLIALPVVIYNLTGSALGTSVAFLVELVPGIVLAPLAGWCADRWDRRRILVLASLGQAVALLPLVAVHSSADLPVVYAVMLIEAALLTLFDPAKNALLPSLVDPRDLLAANSLVGLGQNVARLVGGPLGGVLLATGGLRLVVGADLISYLAAAVLLGRLRPGRSRRAAPGVSGSLRHDPGSFWSVALDPRVRAALLIALLAQVAQGVFVVLFILFVEQRLHGGSSEVGLLRGVQAAGAIAAGIVLAALARRWRPAQLIAGSALAFGVIDLLIWNGAAVTTSPVAYVLLFAVVGAPGIVFGTALVSALQADSPAHQHGRVFSAAGLASNAGQVLGMLAAGLLTAPLGLMGLLNAQAVLYLATGALALVLTARRGLAASGSTRACALTDTAEVDRLAV